MLPASFFEGPADALALALLGCELAHGGVRLRITETEAYLGPHDSAAHSRSGPTKRNAPTFGPAGHAYVYLCYGLHQMLNIVAGPEGSAVLIRAARPVLGEPVIRERRGGKRGAVLLTGPGKVAQALAVDARVNGQPLYRVGGLEAHTGAPPGDVLIGPRVGIDFAAPDD